MSLVLDHIAYLATADGLKPALSDGHRTVNYSQLNELVNDVACWLKAQNIHSFALSGDNSLEWLILDLAAHKYDLVVLPIPTFFSSEQIEHVISQSRINTIASATCEEGIADFSCRDHLTLHGFNFSLHSKMSNSSTRERSNPWPKTTQKLTFTSGSTGRPKGVCLSLKQLEATASSLASCVVPRKVTDHLCVMPFATLLENLAGIYVPLLSGGTIHVRPMAEIGLEDVSKFHPDRFLKTLLDVNPESMILVPQLLLALVTLKESGFPVPVSFKFIAVGGGAVSPELLARSEAVNLPIFQGYGLSECASVVALNTPLANQMGSCGQLLPHVEAKIADDGEIMIKGSRMLGYLGEENRTNDDPWLATGDLGYFDDAGYLFIYGRKKNLVITAFGRNLNPEWPEAKLTQTLAIQQAVVFGNNLEENVAIIVPRTSATPKIIDEAVTKANETLPLYARIGRYQIASEPFTEANGLATANGRPKRHTIERQFYSTLYGNTLEETPMSFYETLQLETTNERNHLMTAPVIQAVAEGRFDLNSYQYFLAQAYHHVKHTVPLMMACGAKLAQQYEWVREALLEYLNEEYGHQEWILNDIAASGGDAEAVRNETPGKEMDLMVAYLYDAINRKNPMSFFGMVLVLEGTSVQLATQLGKSIQSRLELPDEAFSYLYSHGELDLEHIEFFKTLMNKIENEADQQAIIQSAKYCYQLYGDMLRAIPLVSEDIHSEGAHKGVNQHAA